MTHVTATQTDFSTINSLLAKIIPRNEVCFVMYVYLMCSVTLWKCLAGTAQKLSNFILVRKKDRKFAL